MNKGKLLGILLIVVLGLAACQPMTAEPTEVPPTEAMEEAEPTEEEHDLGMVPSVTVEDQTVQNGQVIVASAVSDGPGWVVIHAEQDGAPGPVVGQAALVDGENTDIAVDIDPEAATTTLYAMLHTDSGEEGTYDFPDGDPPVEVDGKIVVKSFQAEQEETGLDSARQAEVEVVDSAFEPEEVEISAGTTVVWTQTGSLPHTVTADDGTFDSGDMSSGDTFEYTFEEPGTYPYYCAYHGGEGGEGMSGVITVTQ
jgi:plastocyanin